MKIRIENNQELNLAIDKVAGKAHALVHVANRIRTECEALYNRLNKHLAKNALVGTQFHLSSFPDLPKAYGARKVIYTKAVVEAFPSGLFVVSITRHEDWAGGKGGGCRAALPEPIKELLRNQLYQKEVVL